MSQFEQFMEGAEEFLHHDPQKLRYLQMFQELRMESYDKGAALLGLERAPAATRHHHAYEGGLLSHYLEMWETWLDWSSPQLATVDRHFCNQEVFKAIVHHDLHKAWRYYELESEDPWKVVYSKNHTQQIFSRLTKTLWLLQHYGIKLDMEQYHTLTVTEGGWAEIKTKTITPFAKFIYLLDEYSANILGRTNPIQDLR